MAWLWVLDSAVSFQLQGRLKIPREQETVAKLRDLDELLMVWVLDNGLNSVIWLGSGF